LDWREELGAGAFKDVRGEGLKASAEAARRRAPALNFIILILLSICCTATARGD